MQRRGPWADGLAKKPLVQGLAAASIGCAKRGPVMSSLHGLSKIRVFGPIKQSWSGDRSGLMTGNPRQKRSKKKRGGGALQDWMMGRLGTQSLIMGWR